MQPIRLPPPASRSSPTTCHTPASEIIQLDPKGPILPTITTTTMTTAEGARK